ncbi:DUF664 domain-containing protein [Nonomuraea sp. NPDC004580]
MGCPPSGRDGWSSEYARHDGHADILRERIDGTTGTWPRLRRLRG